MDKAYLYGKIILVRFKDGKVYEVQSNVGPVSIIVLNQDTGEYEYPFNVWLEGDELNVELDKFSGIEGQQ